MGCASVLVVQDALQLRVTAAEARVADGAREEVRRRCVLGSARGYLEALLDITVPYAMLLCVSVCRRH